MSLRPAVLVAACTLVLPALASAAAPSPGAWRQKVAGSVLAEAERTGSTEFLVLLSERADLSPARALRGQRARGRAVFEALRATADRTQAPLRRLLAERGAEHRAYWITNAIWARGDASLLQALARRPEVDRIAANPRVRVALPRPEPAGTEATLAAEWGVGKIGAPSAWARGVDGSGIVVAGQDTGYDWDHPALKAAYRGWDGAAASHAYNWHDAVHSAPTNPCGGDSPEPCDDHGHGTHTMGTVAGLSGTNQIGVAPGARWIGCRNMDEGVGTPATYTECLQWFLAPTDLAGQNPDPAKAPQVINNSWGCPTYEGCTDPDVLRSPVESLRAAGIVVVASAGNSGSSCSTVEDPPAIYDAAFSVGATDSTDAIASFSSRGPVTVDGSNRLKPDVSAPGVSVRSCAVGTGYTTMSGTSMASPHVTGLVALLLQARPELDGDVDEIERVVRETARPLSTTQNCGGTAGLVPNNVFGSGRVDALAAVVSGTGPLADLDGNLRSDLLWRKAATGENGLWLMNGTQVASASLLPGLDDAWELAGAGDLDGDGRADLVWRRGTTGENAVWLMDGASVRSGSLLASVASPWTVAGTGDLDGDGKDDLLWRQPASGENAAWLMNGATIASAASLPAVPAFWRPRLGDLDRDGHVDVLWRDETSGANAAWLMDGATIAAGGSLPPADVAWAVEAAVDLDGDGRDDVVWRNGSTGENAAWFMNGAAVASSAFLPAVGTTWALAAAGDLDGDGHDDLLWRDGSTGQNAVWLMDGATIAAAAFTTPVGDAGWAVAAP